MRVLVFGDSISQGFWDTEGGWVERLRKHYDTLALKDLHVREFTTVFNLGISGDTSANLVDRVESETRVRKWPGEGIIVIFAIGTNDDLFADNKEINRPDEFRKNILTAVNSAEPLVEKIMFVGNAACDEKLTTPVFWTNKNYTNQQMQAAEQILQEVAKEKSLPFVPIFDVFKKRLEHGDDLLADGLHPNDVGHELIFQLVRPELDKLLA